jgi:membrane protein YqaA with SNARE-associated domain
MDFVALGYWGMFLAAFLAATVLPLGSEVVFTSLLYYNLSPIWLTVIAALGNTLGGLTSYYLGYLAKWNLLTKWFKVSEPDVQKYLGRIQHYGAPLAVLTWLPIVGDVLAVGLGFARTKVLPTSLWMALGKFIRFAVIAYGWIKLAQ